jgi:hypothetical protein
MKALQYLLVLLFFGCRPDEQTDLKSATPGRDPEYSNQSNRMTRTIMRGDNVLVRIVKFQGKRGTHTSRFYYVGGDNVLTESDYDGDGVFEFLLLRNPAGNVLEAFERVAESIQPIEAAELEKLRKIDQEAVQFWNQDLEKPVNPETPK